MNRFHPLSFSLGLGSGVIVLFLVFGTMHLFRGTTVAAAGAQTGAAGQFQGGGAPNTARMAARLGITEDELTKELASGKTMQQIAQEHGVTFGGGRGGPRQGSGTIAGSGTTMTTTTSGSHLQQ